MTWYKNFLKIKYDLFLTQSFLDNEFVFFHSSKIIQLQYYLLTIRINKKKKNLYKIKLCVSDKREYMTMDDHEQAAHEKVSEDNRVWLYVTHS